MSNQHTYPCDSCGADLTYEPGTASLTCDYCGAQTAIGAAGGAGGTEGAAPVPTEVVEYDFREAVTKARRTPTAGLVQGGQEVACDGCGARTVVEGPSGACPYCDSPVVVAQSPSEDVIAPESLLPFKVTETAANDSFYSWVKSLWFAPNDLGSRALAEKLTGVFMPYWTYDSETTTRYRGERGEHYYVDETYTDSEGNTKTKQTRKTRWYSASGTVRVSFDDVLVCASKSLPTSLVQGLEPWDLGELRPYDPAFLSGMTAERYAIDLEDGFKHAEERMKPKIRQECCDDIGGDEQRVHSMNVRHDDVTFKHFLLPLWISAFRYNEKVYRFTVNARNGNVSGERPYSWIKITLFVLFIVAIIVGIVVATSAGKG